MSEKKTDKKQDLNFRKTALKKVGGFTPAKKGCVAGVGIVKSGAKKVSGPK